MAKLYEKLGGEEAVNAGNLVTTLQELNIAQELIDEVVEIVGSV